MEVCWPRFDCLPFGTQLVLMAMRPETLSVNFSWLGTSTSSPVRSFGLLTEIAVAMTQFKASRMRERYIGRLEQKQAKVRVIQQVKQLVTQTRGVSEEHAYQLLRSKAMLKSEQIRDGCRRDRQGARNADFLTRANSLQKRSRTMALNNDGRRADRA